VIVVAQILRKRSKTLRNVLLNRLLSVIQKRKGILVKSNRQKGFEPFAVSM